MAKAKRGEGAKAKLKAYFMAHVGQVLAWIIGKFPGQTLDRATRITEKRKQSN